MASRISRLLADERARFVAIGGVNTLVAYLLFVLLEWATGGSYLLSLGLSYALATMLAFVLHRRYTFGVTGRQSIALEFLRFESVYVVMLLVNAAMLFLLVDRAGWPSILAQAAIIVVTTVLSYLGHRFFSFRRR